MMKFRPTIISVITAVLVSLTALFVVACEGRANIVNCINGDQLHDNEKLNVYITLDVGEVRSNKIFFRLNIVNYYDDDLYKYDIEDCGLIYRRSSDSQSSERTYTIDCYGSTTTMTLTGLSARTKYTVTPFVRFDDISMEYVGQPITVYTD